MKNHVTEQDLKPDTPLPLAIAVHEGAIVGSDADDAGARTAKATGNHANAQVKSQPGSQCAVDLDDHNK